MRVPRSGFEPGGGLEALVAVWPQLTKTITLIEIEGDMSAVSSEMTTSFYADALRGLSDGLDAKKIDDFLDRLFELATMSGSVTCNLSADHVLRLQSPNQGDREFDLPRGKSKLRMVCARLAVRCSDWAHRKVAPYGDMIEIVFPGNGQLYRVRFENTTAAQELAIAAISVGHKSNGQ